MNVAECADGGIKGGDTNEKSTIVKSPRRQFLKLHKIKCLLPNDKWTLAGEENLLLVVRVFLLVLLKHFDLFEAFESKCGFIVATLNQLHPSESAHA